MSKTVQLEMLGLALDMIEASGKNPYDAYQDLLQFTAYTIGMEGISTPAMKLEVNEALKETLDIDLLQREKWDWFGEIYEQRKIVSPVNAKFYVSRERAATIASRVNEEKRSEDDIPTRMLDPKTGSGGLLMEMYNKYGHAMMYYGAEPSVVAYRTALINTHLHNIPARILCADHEVVDLSKDSKNWQYSNMWEKVPEKRFIKKGTLTK